MQTFEIIVGAFAIVDTIISIFSLGFVIKVHNQINTNGNGNQYSTNYQKNKGNNNQNNSFGNYKG